MLASSTGGPDVTQSIQLSVVRKNHVAYHCSQCTNVGWAILMATSKSLLLLATFSLAAAGLMSVPATRQADAMCGYADPIMQEQLARRLQLLQPSQKAFIKWDPLAKIEAVSVQPRFEGNAKDFGMLIPTPSRPKIDEMPRDLFRDLARFTLLFPAPEPMHSGLDAHLPPEPPGAADGGSGFGQAGGDIATSAPTKSFVRVLESGVVGSLDYKILDSNNSSMLFEWLKKNKYGFKGDEPTLEFYIKRGWVFTVMRIDSKQMKKTEDGKYLGEITPTRFTFSTDKCIYPLRITQHSVKDKTTALFYVHGPNQMDLPKQWSWKHSYRPVFLNYRISSGAVGNLSVELRSRENWINARRKQDPQFVPTELEWSKLLTQSDMNTLENPSQFYAKMAPMDLPPGSKVLSKKELLQDYQTALAKLLGGVQKAKASADYHCFDYFPPEDGGFSVRYPDRIVGNEKMFSTHYAFYRNRTYTPSEADSVVKLKGFLQKGLWLTKFSRDFSKAEMTEDMVLDDLSPGQLVTYTRLLPNASERQRERYREQLDRAAGRPETLKSDLPLGSPRPMGNISPYRKDMLARIKAHYHPTKEAPNSVVLVEIAKDGQLLRAEVLESSGQKQADKKFIEALEYTKFAPLPNWYRGESIPFKIQTHKVLQAEGK